MKVTIDRLALMRAFGAISGVVPTKSPKPILQNTMLVCKDDCASLVATDSEVGIRYFVGIADIKHPGSVLLPNRVNQIAKLSTEKEMVIETRDDKILIRSGKSRWELPSEDPDLFPDVGEFGAADYFTVSDSSLKSAIRRTIFAVDEDSTRYALGGALVEFVAKDDGYIMNMVTCDGRRLATQTIDASVTGTPDERINGSNGNSAAPVIPAKALKLIDKLLGDDGNEVSIAVDKSGVTLSTGEAVITTRIVEGRFPRYQDVFIGQVNHELTMRACDLLSGVNQAAILTSEESRGVRFDFNLNELQLSAKTPDRGSANVSVEMPDSDGIGFPVAFDPQYLSPMLRTLPEDTPVTISFENSRSGVRFGVEPGYRYFIMPLNLESAAK